MEKQSAYEAVTERNYQAILREEEKREELIDEILSDDDLFTLCAKSYARVYDDLIPAKSFIDYSVGLVQSMRNPEYKNAWRDE